MVTVVTAVVAVVTAVTADMVMTLYGPLVDAIMVWMDIMNVSVFVIFCFACTYDVGRYVLLVLY